MFVVWLLWYRKLKGGCGIGNVLAIEEMYKLTFVKQMERMLHECCEGTFVPSMYVQYRDAITCARQDAAIFTCLCRE